MGNKIKNKNKKGAALVFALTMIFIVGIILAGAIQFVVSQTKFGSYSASKEEAFQIAEAGISFYRWYLIQNLTGKSSAQARDFWKNGSPLAVGAPACGEAGAFEVEYKDPSGGPLGKYCLEITVPSDWSTNITIKSVGWTYKYPENKRTIETRLRRAAWSEYMILADKMFRLSEETVIHGKMHSNEGIHFDGTTYNIATAGASSYCDTDSDVSGGQRCMGSNGRSGRVKPGVWTNWSNEYNQDLRSTVFRAGKTFPVADYNFDNLVADFELMRIESKIPGRGLYFDNSGSGRHIMINPDGKTMNVCVVSSFDEESNVIERYLQNDGHGTCNSCSDSKCRNNFDIPDEGVVYVEDNLWIEGRVDGKRVTFAAENPLARNGRVEDKKNIFLLKDLRYSSYDGTDVIGLASQNDIEIIENSANVLRVDAALVAKDGRVGRNYYNGRRLNKISIFGSIATRGRLGFGFTDGSGYQNRDLVYDNNLLYFPPPYFPSGTEYLMDLWEEL